MIHLRSMIASVILCSIFLKGFSDGATQMRYLYAPSFDGLKFNGVKTQTTVNSDDECAVLCFRTKHCNTFTIANTTCIIYSPPYAFLTPSTSYGDAKTYRSVFDLPFQACDGNFTYDANGNMCYLFMDGDLNEKSWNDAFLYCLELDSILVIWDTEEKAEQYKQIMQTLGLQTKHWWAGGIDIRGQNKDWEWLNGRQVNDSQWMPNEPSSLHEYCVEIRAHYLRLNDEGCNSKRNFICEKQLSF